MLKTLKTFDQYTGREVELLTDEAVLKIIDWECADKGAPLLPVRPIEPEKHDHEPDMEMYTVGGYNGFHTDRSEDALKILDVLKNSRLFELSYADYSSSYNIKKANPKSSTESNIDSSKVFSPEKWELVKNDVKRHQEEQKRYEEALREFNACEKARSEISNNVWSTVHSARRFKNKRSEYRVNLQKYIDLAEGAQAIGFKFFEKAYSDFTKYLSITIPGNDDPLIIIDIPFQDEFLSPDVNEE